MADERINTDLKGVSCVFQGGIARFREKNARMMAFIDRREAKAMEEINELQSVDIAAGFLPDDDSDIEKILDEIEEEADKNLEERKSTIRGTTTSTKAVIATSGFMRLSKAEGSIKTFPGGN